MDRYKEENKNQPYEFKYSYQSPNELLPQQSKKAAQTIKPITNTPTSTQNQATTSKNEKQKQKNKNSNQFYQVLMLNKQKFSQYQIEPYLKQTQRYISIKNNFQFGGFAIFAVTAFFQQKLWFKLTTNPGPLYAKIIALLFIPGIVINTKIDRNNYQFYKNNQLKIDSVLTLQQKKSMNLSNLISKYQ